MPFFDEGSDPLDVPAVNPAGRIPTGINPPDPFNAPSGDQVLGAAFRQNNPVVSVLDAITRSRPDMTPVEGYDPVKRLSGTENDDLIEQSLADVNPAQTDARITQKNEETQRKQLLASSGWAGTVASVIAGAADPTMYLPVIGELNVAREAGTVLRLGHLAGTPLGEAAVAAGRMAATGALSATASETALQASQETRSWKESAGNIASAALLMGILGGAHEFLSPVEREAAAAAMDESRPRAVIDPATGEASVVNDNLPENAALAQAAGAAATDPRDLTPKSYGFNTVAGIKDVANAVSPNQRIYGGVSTEAKRALANVAETATRFSQHDEGVPTALNGAPLESIVRVQQNQLMTATHDLLKDSWIQHYYGDTKPNAVRVAAGMEGIGAGTQGGKLSYADFKAAVYDAGVSGDQHEIPEVQQAAQMLRSRVLDPVKQFAQQTTTLDGKPMLSTEMDAPAGDQSFMPRQYVRNGLISKYHETATVTANWLESEQAKKAAAKVRMTAYNGALQSHEASIAKIEAKLQGRTDALEGIQDRQEEITRLNKFAYQRAEKLRESQYRNDGGIRVDVPGKGIDNARGGAVFETNIRGRGNALADRASGKGAEIENLERQLIHETDSAKAMRSKIEKEIADWEGQSSAEAKSALKTRAEAEKLREQKMAEGSYQGEGGRLTGADGAVDRAVRSIIGSDRDLSRADLESRAREVVDRLIGSPDGRVPYDAASGGPRVGFTGGEQQVRGALNSRDFAMPTSMFPAGVINKDVEHVMSAHLRTMLPDIHLTARMGDVDMTDTFRRVQDEYSQMITPEMPEKKRIQLFKKRDSDLRDLAAARDRLRGVYGWNPDPTARKVAGIVRDFQNVTAMSALGTSVINRLSDIGANAVFRYGLMNVFHDVWTPLFQGMLRMSPVVGIAKQQARDMGIGVDGLLGHMRKNLHDVNDDYQAGNRFSRGIAWAADRSMLINGHGPWTDYMKAMNWNVAQGEFGRTAKRIADGAATKSDLQRMADANISQHMAAQISEQYEAHSIEVGGRKFANTSEWTNKSAKQTFEAAMSREANINVITAGIGDKPLWLSKPIGGLIGQFKGFTAGAHEKILISNLQQRDGRVLQGVLTSLAMGTLSYRLYTLVSGQEMSSNPADIIKEAANRSAMTGWFNEGNQVLSKFSGGKLDLNRLYGASAPLTRRSNASPLAELLGPTYARAEGLAGIVSHVAGGTGSANDIHQGRMALPLQNLMGFRIGLDKVEDGFAESLGLKPRNRDLGAGMPPH